MNLTQCFHVFNSFKIYCWEEKAQVPKLQGFEKEKKISTELFIRLRGAYDGCGTLILFLQITSTEDTLRTLERETGIEVRGWAEGTITVPERLKIDLKRLRSYLNWVLKLHHKGDDMGKVD